MVLVQTCARMVSNYYREHCYMLGNLKALSTFYFCRTAVNLKVITLEMLQHLLDITAKAKVDNQQETNDYF